jgi:hypothetical protein
MKEYQQSSSLFQNKSYLSQTDLEKKIASIMK